MGSNDRDASFVRPVSFRRNLRRAESETGTFAQRLLVRVEQRHPYVPAIIIFFNILFELCDLCLYVWGQTYAVCTNGFCWHSEKERAPVTVQRALFYLRVALHGLFFLQWAALLWASSERLAFFVSRWSVVTLTTSTMVAVVTVATFFDARWAFYVDTLPDGTTMAESPWLPTFLRIWTLYETFVFMLNSVQVMVPPVRAIIEMVVGLWATMATAVCVFQSAESYFGDRRVSMFEALYFAVVTFGTIGFGDIRPTTWITRQIVVVIIIVAVYTFPAFFSNIAGIARRIIFYDRYKTRNRRHVIFTGNIGAREISFFINEFCGGFRRFDDLNLVILSPNEYNQDLRMTATASPELNKRVTLMVGDPRRRSDLDRAAASKADCIFVANTDDSAASSVDADMLLITTTIYQYNATLPQHIVMRRGRNLDFVRANNVQSILEKERLKCALLGTGAVSSGVIPFVINLVRSYDSDVEARNVGSWKQQTEWSMSNEIYSFSPPECMVGLSFQLCSFLYRPACVTVIGIVSAAGVVHFNPYLSIDESMSLLAIAPNDDIIHQRTAELSLQAASRSIVPPTYVQYSKPKAHITDENGGIRGRDAAPVCWYPGRSGLPSLVRGLQHHVVVIDLHSAHREDPKAPQGKVDSEVYRAEDLFNVLRSVKLQEPQAPVLLLSRGKLHSAFCTKWEAAGYDPIHHVNGCGLNADDLAACNVHEALGVLVFSTAETVDPDADTMTMLVTASIDEQCRKRGNRLVPVVSDMKHMESLTLVPPYYSDDSMNALAAENFAFEPAFVVGRVICSRMLDSALYQTYFNPEILRVVDAIIQGGDGKSAAISSMPMFSDLHGMRFADVEARCAAAGCLAVALYRRIVDPVNRELEAHRFMFINPHPDCEVDASDFIYFLK